MRFSRIPDAIKYLLIIAVLFDILLMVVTKEWIYLAALSLCIYLYSLSLSWVKVSDDGLSLIHLKNNLFLKKITFVEEKIPYNIKNILFQDRDYKIRALQSRAGGLYYKDAHDFQLFFYQKDKSKVPITIFRTSDVTILYKGAEYISKKLEIPLIENETFNSQIEDDDNLVFERTGRQRFFKLKYTINYFSGKLK